MTRMTGPDYAVMCNLINAYTYTERERERESVPFVAFDQRFS